ncbi:MAG: oligosaccharide flippase family protein [Desulfobulbaceae bacterium]|nr:oligosaccharide flippase family protein [Desulfobulbaceae bacterium]
MIIKRITASSMGVASQMLGNVTFFVLLARMWEPRYFGKFVYIYSLTALLVLAVDYGYPQRVLRDVPRQRFRNRINLINGVSFNVFSAMIVLSLALLQVAIGENPAVFIVTLALVVGSFADYFGSHLRAIGQHKVDSVNIFLSNLLLVTALIVLVFLRSSVLSMVTVSIVLLLAKLLHLALSYDRVVKAFGMRLRRIRLRRVVVKRELLNGFSYAMDIFVLRAYGALDTVLLKFFAGDFAVGVYQSGQRMLQGFLPFAQVVNNVFLPMLSVSKDRRLWVLFVQLCLICLIVGSGCAAFFFFLGEWTVKFVFGKAYSGINQYLWQLGMLGFLRFASAPLAIFLTSTGRQPYRIKCNSISIMLMIGCAVVLVPIYGIAGLVFSLIISSVSVIILYVFGISTLERQ